MGVGGKRHIPAALPQESRAITLLHLWAFVACYRVSFTFSLSL